MSFHPIRIALAGVCTVVAANQLNAAKIASDEKLSGALPLDVAVTRARDIGSHLNLAPNGEWLALDYSTADEAIVGPPIADAMGYSFRSRTMLVNSRTGEQVELGEMGTTSYGATWSPDSARVVFGQRGAADTRLYVWDLETRKTEPLDYLGPAKDYGSVGWLPDGHRFVITRQSQRSQAPMQAILTADGKPLPANVTRDLPQFTPVDQQTPSVLIYRSKNDSPNNRPITSDVTADLLVVDLRERSVRQLTRDQRVMWYEPSPDGQLIAYTVHKEWEPIASQVLQDIDVIDIAGLKPRTLAAKEKLWKGDTISWSPDSRSLAYVTEGTLDPVGECFLLSVSDGARKRLGGAQAPNFQLMDDTGFNYSVQAPIWNADRRMIYLLSAQKELWALDSQSNAVRRIGGIAGHTIESVLSARGHASAAKRAGAGFAESKFLVMARDEATQQTKIFRMNPLSGKALPVSAGADLIFRTGVHALTPSGKSAAVQAESAQKPRDVWILETASGALKQVSHLNREMERYPMASARLINWMSASGQPRHGALLLPPGYRQGRRYPLLVWVYGNQMGSHSVNRFGLGGFASMQNQQIPATRGYAVLFPDAPLRQGTPVADLADAVLPGVDQAIALGYADPDRLAVSGYSYGGYSTLALIIQTDRFKAAIAGGFGDVDLFSSYVELGQRAGGAVGTYFEVGQGNIGGSPWQYRQRYFDNSPFFFLDRVTTPILMHYGANDGGIRGADNTYKALRRLGKAVEYRLYESEGHGFMRAANVVDYWQSQIDFLAKHLDAKVDARGAVIFDGNRAQLSKAEGLK